VADDPGQAGRALYQPEENLDAERAQMEAYISVIRSRVSLERVSLSVFTSALQKIKCS
jgi:hypothetical protein